MNSKQKVIVGISGGVDSSVAAYLLKEQGYQVEGLFMKNWEQDDDDEYCTAADDLADAQAICAKLNITLNSINFSQEYLDNVFKYFLDEYQYGRTPNPDILCNQEIKFKAFLNHALKMGADFIATGHYARHNEVDGKHLLLKGKDSNKDQSYFLYAISNFALSKTIFPTGGYTKEQVRKIAKEQGLITHDKKDSTGICFIGERKFKKFLNEYLLTKPGDIYSTTGELLGRHDGIMFYTLGQRQGLHIGGKKGHLEAPWYVVDKDITQNKLIIAQGTDHPMLYSQGLICQKVHWLNEPDFDFPLQCSAKARYRQADQHCIISPQEDGKYCVMFNNKQRAITPGQSVVFYQKNICLGGGIIEKIIR